MRNYVSGSGGDIERWLEIDYVGPQNSHCVKKILDNIDRWNQDEIHWRRAESKGLKWNYHGNRGWENS